MRGSVKSKKSKKFESKKSNQTLSGVVKIDNKV